MISSSRNELRDYLVRARNIALIDEKVSGMGRALRSSFDACAIQFQQQRLKKANDIERQFAIGRDHLERADGLTRDLRHLVLFENGLIDDGGQPGIIAQYAAIALAVCGQELTDE